MKRTIGTYRLLIACKTNLNGLETHIYTNENVFIMKYNNTYIVDNRVYASKSFQHIRKVNNFDYATFNTHGVDLNNKILYTSINLYYKNKQDYQQAKQTIRDMKEGSKNEK